MNFKAIKTFHDGTLKEINLSWEQGIVIFKIQLYKDRIIWINCSRVVSLVCSREFPWGESNSINELEIIPKNKKTVLRIEMQSGDILTAEFENLKIVEESGE